IAHALDEAALDLSFDHAWIDRSPDVVRRPDTQHAHCPGNFVHLGFHRLRTKNVGADIAEGKTFDQRPLGIHALAIKQQRARSHDRTTESANRVRGDLTEADALHADAFQSDKAAWTDFQILHGALHDLGRLAEDLVADFQ